MKRTRHTMYVVDGKGKFSKYQKVSAQKKAVQIKTRKAKLKVNAKKQVPSVPKATQEELRLPTCKVVLTRLSKADIQKKIEKVERDGKIRAIKDEIKSLPRNYKDYFYISNIIHIQSL